MEIGRVCIKLRGREAGRKCVIINVLDRNYVLVAGVDESQRVRRRRVNMKHIEPQSEKLNIGRDASDEEIRKALVTE